jgi:putative membrane protein
MIQLNDRRITVQEWLKTLVLLGMAVYLGVLLATGSLANYINLRFAWLIWIALLIFSTLGLWNIYRLLQIRKERYSFHQPLSWTTLLIVALPLIFALAVPSQPLSADAIQGSISLQAIGGVSATARFDLAPEERNVLDWLRIFDRTATPAQLDGLPVDVIAFVYREPDMQADQFLAARFTLSCCVADALAIGIPVQYAQAAALVDGTWVRIRGTLRAGTFQGYQMPVIHPESIEPVEPPATPYLYS